MEKMDRIPCHVLRHEDHATKLKPSGGRMIRTIIGLCLVEGECYNAGSVPLVPRFSGGARIRLRPVFRPFCGTFPDNAECHET